MAPLTLAESAQGALTGNLATSTSAAFSNGVVVLYSQSGPATRFIADVSADGTFSVANVPPGSYTAVAFADGFGAFSQTVNISAGNNVSNLPLQSGTTHVKGRVVDPAGNPVAGAIVQLVNPANQVLGEATTKADGTYDITSASGSNLRLVVSLPGQQGVNVLAAPEVPEGGETDLPDASIDFAPNAAAETPTFDLLGLKVPEPDFSTIIWTRNRTEALTFGKDKDHVDSIPVQSSCKNLRRHWPTPRRQNESRIRTSTRPW